MERVLPVVTSIASRYPQRTVFTRFLTPRVPTDMPGMWQRYYSRWQQTTTDRIDPALLELVSPLARLSRLRQSSTNPGFPALRSRNCLHIFKPVTRTDW
jgi:hypothetical protein